MKIKICNAATLAELKVFDLASTVRTHGECIVGRSPDVPLVLDSDDVSRQHGKFSIQDGNYHFCDLGSSNGSVINDRIVEPNQPYSLKNGDAVHVGDFVLLLEEQPQELAQTVVRVIDPWMFKPKPPEIVVSNPATEVPLPQTAASEVASIVESIDPVEIDALPLSIVDEVIVDNFDLVTPLNPATEPIAQPIFAEVEEVESIDLIIPTDAITPNIDLAIPVDVSTQTIVQTGYTELESIDPIEPTDEVIPNIDLAIPIDPSIQTVGQAGNVVTPVFDEVEPIEPVAEITPDLATDVTPDSSVNDTIVQTGYPVSLPVEVVATEATIDLEKHDNLIVNIELEPLPVDPSTQTLAQKGYPEIPPVAATEDPITNVETYIPALTIADPVEDANISADPPVDHISEVAEVLPVLANIDLGEEEVDLLPLIDNLDNIEAADNLTLEAPATIPTVEPDLELVANEEISFDFDEEVDNISTIEPVVDLALEEQTTPTVENTLQVEVENEEISPDDDVDVTPTIDSPDRVTDVDNSGVETAETAPSIDSTLQVGVVAGVATIAAVSDFDQTEITDPSPVIEEEIMPLETAIPINAMRQSAIDALSTKQIIAISHESISPDLIDFIDVHKSFFAKCALVSWLSISQELNQQTGINLSQAIPSGMSGGYQRIAAMINSGEVAAVIFLRDFLQPQAGQTNEESLLRLCNINQILLATNTTTAEAIVSYLS